MRVRARLVVPVGLAVGFGVLHRLGSTYGSTAQERAAPLPGDELVVEPRFTVNHATTIDAGPDRVWPWLVQMGWHRGGWYTARWVDRLLFPANRASSERIIPELQDLAVGDFVPDGPPESECGFVVRQLQPQRHLVLRSTTHLPLRWRSAYGATVDWTWAFVLQPLDGGTRTRFLFRWRARAAPWWVVAGTWAAIVPADFVMSRDMMRGVRRRAERTPAGSGHGTTPGPADPDRGGW